MQPVLARDNGLATYRETRRLSMVPTAVCRLFPLALTTVWFYRSLYLSRPHIQPAKCIVLAKKRLFDACFNEPPHLPPHFPCHYHCQHRHHRRHHHRHHHYHHHGPPPNNNNNNNINKNNSTQSPLNDFYLLLWQQTIAK